MTKRSKKLLFLSVTFIILGVILFICSYFSEKKPITPADSTQNVDGLIITSNPNNISDNEIVTVNSLKELNSYLKYVGKKEQNIIDELGEGRTTVVAGSVIVSRIYNIEIFGEKCEFVILPDSDKVVTDIYFRFIGKSLDTWVSYFNDKLKCEFTKLEFEESGSDVYTWKDNKFVYSLKNGDSGSVELAIRPIDGGK